MYLSYYLSCHSRGVDPIIAGRKILIYEGHSGEVHGIAWSPDGRRIVSGSSDGTFQVWDATTGDTLFTYQSHSAIRAVAWSPDGLYLACTGYDKTVDIWQIS